MPPKTMPAAQENGVNTSILGGGACNVLCDIPVLPAYLIGIHVGGVLMMLLVDIMGAAFSQPNPINQIFYDLTVGPYLGTYKVLSGGGGAWQAFLPLVGLVVGAAFVYYYRKQHPHTE